MSGVSLIWFVQFSVMLLMVYRTEGKVTAPSHIQALLGQPSVLHCELSLAKGERLKQVQWLDQRNRTFLTYRPGEPVSVEDANHIHMVSANASSVSILKVGPMDVGCYTCVFYVYPTESQEGRVCLTVTEVDLEGNKTAVSGTLATLSCRYTKPGQVRQVVWKKTAEQGDTIDVAYNNRQGVSIAFKDRMSLSSGMDETQLSIKSVRTEDEACYTCEFHTFPEGMKDAVACLSVYVLPHPQVSYRSTSPGVTEANCTALARPPATIEWNVEGHNKTLGPSAYMVFQQGDGTSLSISTLLFHNELLNEQSVDCLVYHPGLESAASVSINGRNGKALTILISVTATVALLILCLCVCLWRCFLRKDY